ncbi:6-phospho-beta-glucosidase [Paludibacterium yongneupense]|uniref:6-phospho-beta-glucosidase n=1 Tax=Paludibacterium yongneupense TaxID=400061 RepID=UPI000428633B|nr:6-phospho-beta-glucosidase [Paludibacterium yongneupense]
MQGKIKVVVIGAGSSYTPELVDGLIARRGELSIGELCLVDIDDGWHKAEIIAALTRRMIEHAGLDTRVVLTRDRKAALAGADFVCSQFRVGLLEARIRDERIALKYGMLGQETNGLGGFTKAQRTIPVVLDICHEMEQLCPDAWLLNFTNPSGIVTEAILRHSKVKAVGLCNVPVLMQKGIAKALQAEEKDVVLQVSGLNHFIFARQVMLHGKDVLPEVLELFLEDNEAFNPKNIPHAQWPRKLLEQRRQIPCPYHRYYFQADDTYTHFVEEAEKEGTRGEVVKALETRLFEIYANPSLYSKPVELEGRGGQYYSDAACDLMSAIYNDKHVLMHVNVRNNGTIACLPDDCAIETTSLITRAGPLPLNVARFDEDTEAMLVLMKAYERFTIDAAVTGSYQSALRALNLNPLVKTGQVLETALDETIRENIRYLPQFKEYCARHLM